jgi:hypothetical protein
MLANCMGWYWIGEMFLVSTLKVFNKRSLCDTRNVLGIRLDGCEDFVDWV